MTKVLVKKPCQLSLSCWCCPELYDSGYRVDGVKLVNLACNDVLGAHLKTWAWTRLWDASWQRQ